MNATPSPLILVIRLKDGNLTSKPLDAFFKIPAEASVDYAIVVEQTGEAPKDLTVKRQGDDLLVEKEGEEDAVLIIEDFYSTPDSGFLPDASLQQGALAGTALGADSPAIATDGADAVIWEPAEGNGGGSVLLWGGALVAGGIAALAGSGGSDETPIPDVEEPPEEPSVKNTVTGTIVAGPVIDSNGLSVTVYAADGETVLGTAKVASNGTFTLDVGDYTGVVIAKVTDSDEGEDYLDESTGANKDLNAALSAMETITEPNTTVTMNINAVTTLASEIGLRATATAPLTPEAVAANNKAVAELFGLADLHNTEVKPTNGGDFDTSDGMSAEEQYGAILASLSGADQINEGDSQKTIEQILEGLSIDSEGKASLSEETQAVIVKGAKTVEVNTGELPSDDVSIVVDTFAPKFQSAAEAPALDENAGAGKVVYTAAATDAGSVDYQLKEVSDYQSLTIDPTTGKVTLTGSPDHETKSRYSFTVVATDAAGNSSEKSVTLAVNDLDETPPTITSGATVHGVNENSGTQQVVYVATAEDSSSVTFSLKPVDDHASFSIDAQTGAVTLAGNPDHESKSSYAFTIVSTDAAGNTAEKPVALAINDLDDTAPTITSGAAAAAIDENSAASQVVYTASADDSADVSEGVAFSLKPDNADDAAAFSIDAATGKVTLTGDPDHEAKSSYAFTVVATDAAGNSSEQAVALAVNDLDEAAPTITSGATAAAIAENSGASQVVYTAAADDSADVSEGVAFSLKPDNSDDAASFSIDAATGKVTLTGDPDHEAKPSYSFTVVATDDAGNSSEQAVALAINDLDDTAPTITSGSAADVIDENSGASQVVYTAAADDSADVSGGVAFSLKPDNADDAAAFSIDAATGKVTLTGDPDHEAKPNYAFTVVATDDAGNSSEQAVTLAVNDLDDIAPTITSSGTPTAIDENSGATQVVYTASADDSADVSEGVAFSLKPDNADDAAAFSIDAATGKVTLTGDPDHETKPSYSFTVVATDDAGNSSEQSVTLAVNDLDEADPSITSGATASSIDENSGADQVVYTATADDSADISGGITFSLKAIDDHAAFSIDADTGEVTLTGDPDHETKASYAFTVVATDAAGNTSEQAATLAVNDLDEADPSITSGATAAAIDENSGAGQVVYTATADDSADISGGVTFSLKTVGDHAAFSIDADTGAVTLTGDPDHETKASYAFTVVATDAAGNTSEQAATLAVNDLDEAEPSITSSTTATAIDENSGASQVVYTAAADDSADVSGGVAFSLKPDNSDDAAAFSIDAATGKVTLTGDPDHETKPSYAFTVVATDDAGNASEQAVTLAINDIVDETAPTVESVAISSATGEQNDTLNAGDVVTATVTMSENTLVDTTDGAPRLAMTIGGATVYADYVSGSGSSALVFAYTILGGQTDANGLAIPEDALDAHGAILRDASDNVADLAHAAVADDASHLVDTVAPTASVAPLPPVQLEAINNTTGFDQKPQITAVGSDGAYVVTWMAIDSDNDDAIFVQRFNADGTTTGNAPVQLEANGSASGADVAPQVTAVGSEGAYVVAWHGDDGSGEFSVFVQRFNADGTTAGAPARIEEMGNSHGSGVYPQITAVGSEGAYVVTWYGGDSDPDSSVFVQRFNADGTTSGAPVQLEATGYAAGSDEVPQITTVGSDGAYVVTWQGRGSDNDYDIFAQRFNADGTTTGNAPVQLTTIDTANFNDQSPQAAAVGSEGAYVVTWYDRDSEGDNSIFVQRFNADGTITGNTPVQLEAIDKTTGNDQHSQVTAVGNDGAYVVTWYGSDSDGDYSIFVQRFNADGTVTGNAPVQLEAIDKTNGADQRPQVAAVGSDGAYVVTWFGQDSDGDYSVFVQQFNADGTTTGHAPVLLEPLGKTNGYDLDVQITAVGSDGAYAVTWYGNDTDGDNSIFVQRFNADGTTSDSSVISNSDSIAARSSETGDLYLVKESVVVDDLGDITGAADNLWNAVAAGSADADAALAATGLTDGDYKLYSVDAAGNLSAASVQTITIDSTAPSFTSGATATDIVENSGAGQVVYTAAATDDHGTSFSLKAVGDHAAFAIDAETGAVTLTGDPDYETKSTYAFAVVATDDAGNASEQAVTLAINDIVDETAPTIDSVAISSATGAQNNTLNSGDVVTITVAMSESATVDTTDGTPRLALDIGGSAVYADYVSGSGSSNLVFTYTILANQTDANGISIGANALDLNGGSIHDAASNAAVITHGSLADNASYLVDTTVPAVTSGATATAVNENSGAGQTIYTAQATDSSALSYSLKATGDHTLLSIDSNTGAVTLTGDPNHEAQASYGFTIVATDAAGNSSEQAVTLNINDLDEKAPSVTSGATATAISENSGASQVVYTASATDTADVDDATDTSGSLTYSLKEVGDHAAFSINGSTGAVTLTGDPDFETKASYDFTVIAKDAANNSSEQAVSLAITDVVESTVDTSIVVFDLVEGVSSDHSGRTFQTGVNYTIYIRVDSDSANLNTDGDGPGASDSWGIWTGSAGVLGSDDKIIFVGDGSPIKGMFGSTVTRAVSDGAGGFHLWSSAASNHWAVFASYTFLSRAVSGTQSYATIWNATGSGTPHLWQSAQFPQLGLAQHYLTQMPAGVMTSQGLG